MKWWCLDFNTIKYAANANAIDDYIDTTLVDVMAVLEVSCNGFIDGLYPNSVDEIDIIDIELTVRDYDDQTRNAIYDYFCCVHFKNYDEKNKFDDGWESYTYIEFSDKEPKYFDSEEELKKDMYECLKRFCDVENIKLLEDIT